MGGEANKEEKFRDDRDTHIFLYHFFAGVIFSFVISTLSFAIFLFFSGSRDTYILSPHLSTSSHSGIRQEIIRRKIKEREFKRISKEKQNKQEVLAPNRKVVLKKMGLKRERWSAKQTRQKKMTLSRKYGIWLDQIYEHISPFLHLDKTIFDSVGASYSKLFVIGDFCSNSAMMVELKDKIFELLEVLSGADERVKLRIKVVPIRGFSFFARNKSKVLDQVDCTQNIPSDESRITSEFIHAFGVFPYIIYKDEKGNLSEYPGSSAFFFLDSLIRRIKELL